ncbi:hypothetical protein C8J56DRAFT_1104743 [Mycena floridula]|nr:hypothetical protein C8J56DRAFT_1104743 [Mycena floridula]
MDSTIGAIEIGTLLSGVLFGLITSQTYVYFKTFPRDTRFTKSLVAALWIVEMVHTACIFNALYMYTVAGYGDPTSLIRFPLALDITIILHGATVIIVQLFFTHRIAKFVQKTYYMSAIAIFILFLRFAAFIVSGVAAAMMTTLLSFMQSWKSLILFDLISCAITDVMMSGILIYQLAMRRPSAYKRSLLLYSLVPDSIHLSTVAIMDKLIMWSVETCLVTTFTTITMLICFLTMKDNFIWIGILLVQPKIFSNALLANLNSRSSLRDNGSDAQEMTPRSLPSPHLQPPSGVTVSQESATFNDKYQLASPVKVGPFPYATQCPDPETALGSEFKEDTHQQFPNTVTNAE